MTSMGTTTRSVHFTPEEFADRTRLAREALDEHELDGMLISRIEDQYWLTGLDTDGFCIFGGLFLSRDGQMTHIARTADVASIRYSSLCDDVYLWIDGEGRSKLEVVRRVLDRHQMKGKRVGIQTDTFGLLPDVFLQLRDGLAGWCELVEASGLIRDLRLIKSSRELEYHRRAGTITDLMQEAAIEETRPGAFEGGIMGRIWYTSFANDGDPPAHRPPIGNGPSALNVRYTTKRKYVGNNDQVTFEVGAGYRHYHAAEMFVILTGPRIDPRHLRMHEACVEALAAVQKVLRPGKLVGDVYEAHRATFARHGYEHAILRACGYTMGATWPPTWMEPPMIVEGSSVELRPNMTFFTHMILTDHDTGLTMSLGEQVIVTDNEPEIISHVPREPLIARS